jgi:hypothetical protein
MAPNHLPDGSPIASGCQHHGDFDDDRLTVEAALAAIGMVQMVEAAGNIDSVNKWACSTNAGWINFNPTHGGVTVCADHLEGYAWGENIGWIRLGTFSGCAAHTYSNTSTADYELFLPLVQR